MQVILLEKVRNLGNLGDTVSVKPGFGRNFLIPQGKAVTANTKNTAKFAEIHAQLEKSASEALAVAQQRAVQLSELSIIITSRAGDEGKLFGSIGVKDLAEAITKAGVNVEKKEVSLPTGPLRTAGEHDIDIILHSDVTTTIKVSIVAEA